MKLALLLSVLVLLIGQVAYVSARSFHRLDQSANSLPSTHSKSFQRIKSKRNVFTSKNQIKRKEMEDARIIAARSVLEGKTKQTVETSIASSTKQPSMLTINLLNFLFYGTMGTVMPFLPTFYKHLGVSGKF